MCSWRRSIVDCLEYLRDIRVVEESGVSEDNDVIVVAANVEINVAITNKG